MTPLQPVELSRSHQPKFGLTSCKGKLLIVVWQLRGVMGRLGNFMSSRANEACFPKDLFHEVGFSGVY